MNTLSTIPCWSRAAHTASRRWMVVLMLAATFAMPGCFGGGDEEEVDTTTGAASMTHHEEDDSLPPVKPVFVPADTPDPKPNMPMKAGASCITAGCHANFAVQSQIHGPVKDEQCNTCHGDEEPVHRFPLKKTVNDTCTFCHNVATGLAHTHKPLETTTCTVCHDPHASNAKYLLTADRTEQLCARCHDLPWQKHVHEPFKDGTCTACHQPHESKFAGLLRGGEGVQHCYMCHDDMKRTIANAPTVHKPAAESCSTCHDPHTSANAFELHKPTAQMCFSCHEDKKHTVESAVVAHDAVFMGNSCGNCHNPHASGLDSLLKDRVDKLCMQCHNQEQKAGDGRTIADMSATLEREFLHGPIRSGDCTACHNAHGSSHHQLLKQTFPKSFYADFNLENYALCFTCHEKELVLEPKTRELTGFRDGDVNLHYVHVHRDKKGRTCKSCHDMHGSDRPKHMADEVPFAGSGWTMNIGFTPTKAGGSCSPGCHQPLSYDRLVEVSKFSDNADQTPQRGAP